MLRFGWVAALISAAVLATGAAGASAAQLTATLTAVNGQGTFDAALPCGAGDGPSWTYGFSGASGTSPAGGALAGVWTGSFEVHDAGGAAFVPHAGGRIAIQLDAGGTANFDLGNGSCTDAALGLTGVADDNPVATGTLPIVGAFGTGAARGLNGTGDATVSLQLAPGAGNQATIQLNGNFGVAAPKLSVGSLSSRWNGLGDFLTGRLTVNFGVANLGPAETTGDAFGVKVLSAGATNGALAVVPAQGAGQRIAAGGAGGYSLTLTKARPNTAYALTITVQGRDGLGTLLAPVTQTLTFKSPLLP